jgi:hypothetical protein
MAKFNKKNVENAPDKIKAGAEEMIKAPMWLIEQILLKHEKAVLEVMKELHDENTKLRGAIERALADSESGTGWGPDVTVCAYLRDALSPNA